MLEDKLLVFRFKLGDRDALRLLYEKYKNDLLKLAVVLVNDVTLAEDAVQDVFANLAESPEKVRIGTNIRSFLSTCAANRVRNLIRGRQKCETSTSEEGDCVTTGSRSPDQQAALNEELKLLSDAMAQIPYEQREVITLHMQSGMTFRQIARVQDVSINTVQGRYRYGVSKLLSLLKSKVGK
jgi:RNA polymerase sigma-70 factor (ECF subfamily)